MWTLYLKLYSIALVAFFVIDMIWLGLVTSSFYKNQIGFLLKTNVNWVAAISFYLLFIIALVVFAIYPGYVAGSLAKTVMLGAFFGLVTYATYDLTNLATLKDWPLLVTLVDMAWGTTLGASVSAITYLVATRLWS